MCTSPKVRSHPKLLYAILFDIVAGISTMKLLAEISWHFVQQLGRTLFGYRFKKEREYVGPWALPVPF